MRTDTPKTIYLKDYQAPAYKTKHTDLRFEIFDGKTIVHATLKFAKNNDSNAPLFLNGEHLNFVSCKLNGENVTPDISDKGLTLPAPAHDEFTLETACEIDPASNTALEGLYQSGGNWCTQCEAEGFRRITYYFDRPDNMATFTVRIEADKKRAPILLSNGNKVDEGELDGNRHFTVWSDPTPKSPHLFALVAGDLTHIHDTFTTRSGNVVDLYIYVRHGDEGQCDHAMRALQASMKWDEDVYGREYQYNIFNIVAVSDFNMGAMENTSLNIFNTALVLAHPDTATDMDFGRVESVIAHEYFHNWTGNRVTCRDWFQLTLKEGLTVFRDQEFSADMGSRAVQRIDDVTHLRRMQFPEDAGPLSHPIQPDEYIEINNFYTMTVYEKGAEVIRMFHTLLGADTYRKATDLYFDRFDGMAVTCEDWAQCMADASGQDLSQFQLWYKQAGTPEVNATSHYDEAAQTFTLTLTQTIPDTPGQTNKKPMHIPVSVGLIGPNGDNLIETQILHLKDATQSFTFEGIGTRPVPSILRNFSAPVKLTTDLSDDDLKFLMVHDSDGFNRWEAGQTFALKTINRMIDDKASPDDLIKALEAILDQVLAGSGDKALLARALALPDVSIIGQSRKSVDPDAIYQARQIVQSQFGARCMGKLIEAYHVCETDEAYAPSSEQMADRAMQATLLRYIYEGDHERGAMLAKSLYENATNMTARVTALGILNGEESADKNEVFHDFYERFRSYELVIDKWFNLQAGAITPNTITYLKNLSHHPDFNWKNPNRVRSLYGAFAMNNPVIFHAADGSGYAFLKEAIIKLNRINPQIAARLLTPLREWKRYTPDRQAHMKDALEEILVQPNLSPDVFEIVSKSLS